VPVKWVARVRASMGQLAPRFSSNRMVREYTERCYHPAAANYRRRAADNGALASQIEDWYGSLRRHWAGVRFGNFYLQEEDVCYTMRVQVYLGGVKPEWVAVELYADEIGPLKQMRIPMKQGEAITGAVNGWVYQADAPKDRPADHYTPRIVPHHVEALVPLEAWQILWLR